MTEELRRQEALARGGEGEGAASAEVRGGELGDDGRAPRAVGASRGGVGGGTTVLVVRSRRGRVRRETDARSEEGRGDFARGGVLGDVREPRGGDVEGRGCRVAFSEPGGGTGEASGFRRGGVRAASAAETHVVVGRGREEGGPLRRPRGRRTPNPPAEPSCSRARQVQRAPDQEKEPVENRRTRTLVALLRGDVRGVVRGRVAIVLRRARRHVAHVVPRRRRRRALREENVVQNSYGRDAGALIVASRVVVAAFRTRSPPPAGVDASRSRRRGR